jgi:hypothetical protein
MDLAQAREAHACVDFDDFGLNRSLLSTTLQVVWTPGIPDKDEARFNVGS